MSAAPRSTGEFVAALRRQGELVEVRVEVDPELELAEIHRRVIAANGPALLFSRVRGSPFPVVTNLYGTRKRVELAFGRTPRALVERVAKLPETLVPPTLGKLWGERKLFARLARVGLRERRSGPVCDVRASPPDLLRLPALKTWKRDGGRFITLPLVLTKHPRSASTNLGMYRVQLYDATRTGLHMQIGKGGGFHLAAAEELGEALPVNIHVGGPPAAVLGAVAPLPENVPELLLASLALGERLPLARNPCGPLPLIAESDFALVGRVEPRARAPEGPFGDHYGYYSETHDYPVFTCDALLHRRDAIFPATVVGKPRQEDFYLGDYLQELLSPLFPLVMPGVRALWSYGETGYHSLSAAVVRERYKREAMASAFRILGEGQLSLTKFLLVIDAPIDLVDFRAVLEHVLARTDPRTDLFLFPNLSMDSLDYAGPTVNEGSKGVWLGLGEPRRTLPREFSGALPVDVRRAIPFCAGCLVVEGVPYAREPGQAARIAAHPDFAAWPLVVLTDDAARAAKSPMNFLWTSFTRFDPSRDLVGAKTELAGGHAVRHAPIALDARMKPWYPEELFADEATAALVDRRWSEYFERPMPMGDSERAHLD
ncbi:MAG: UbiD family decarboxylase [Planctomycetota bacterium]|nr:MAG: UbiD family decarboxylase [Planctomycetota bacterium]